MGTPGTRTELLASSYLALLAGPLVARLAPGWITVSGLTWPLFVAGCLLGGALGYLLARTVDLDSLSRLPVAITVTILPLVYLVWLFGLMASSPGRTLVSLLVRPSTTGVFAFVPALVAVRDATRRATAERIERTDVHASFSARLSPRRRRLQYVALAVGIGTVAGLITALYISGQTTIALLLAVLVSVPALVYVAAGESEKEIVITDEGLVVDGTFAEWHDLESYRITDDSLVVRPSTRWLSALTFDLADIDSLEDVESALDECLPGSGSEN
jgi:hypothetical protein